jgi:hypothetical protein
LLPIDVEGIEVYHDTARVRRVERRLRRDRDLDASGRLMRPQSACGTSAGAMATPSPAGLGPEKRTNG